MDEHGDAPLWCLPSDSGRGLESRITLEPSAGANQPGADPSPQREPWCGDQRKLALLGGAALDPAELALQLVNVGLHAELCNHSAEHVCPSVLSRRRVP
jgi:hypothetical protein